MRILPEKMKHWQQTYASVSAFLAPSRPQWFRDARPFGAHLPSCSDALDQSQPCRQTDGLQGIPVDNRMPSCAPHRGEVGGLGQGMDHGLGDAA
jgi:hypothetical protein